MDINQLKYFLTLYDKKNITSAANNLFITQQGLSASIRNLESELGIRLFERTHRGTIPTPYAEGILPFVQKLLRDYESLHAKIEDEKIHLAGVLKIDADRMLLDILPHGTEKSQNELYPNLVYQIRNTSDRQALEDILHDKVEIAMISGPVNNPEISERILLSYPYCAAVNQGNPLYNCESLAIADLAQQPVTILSDNTNTHTNILRYISQKNIIADIQFIASDPYHLMYLCSVEPVIGIIPRLYTDWFPTKDIRILPLTDADFIWHVEIVYRKDRQLSEAARCWSDYIATAAQNM